MWVFDRTTGAILAVNDAAIDTYRYSREELLACNVDAICPATDRGLRSMPGAERGPWTGTLHQHRKDGSTFEADVSTTEVGTAEHPATMVLVVPKD